MTKVGSSFPIKWCIQGGQNGTTLIHETSTVELWHTLTNSRFQLETTEHNNLNYDTSLPFRSLILLPSMYVPSTRNLLCRPSMGKSPRNLHRSFCFHPFSCLPFNRPSGKKLSVSIVEGSCAIITRTLSSASISCRHRILCSANAGSTYHESSLVHGL